MTKADAVIAVAALLLAINAITWALFWLDKRRARRAKRRIKERTLLACCALGGWPAAYVAMRTLRHKTRDRRFRIAFCALVVAWIAGVAAALYAA